MIIISQCKKPELSTPFEMDGVIEMEDLSGQAQIRKNHFDIDLLSPDQGVDWVNATGTKKKVVKKKGGMFAGMRQRRAQRQERRNLTAQSKADARISKAKAKNLDAKAKIEQAKALGKGDDSALVAALGQSLPATEEKGMSTTTKLVIGGGIVLVLGIITFVVIKMRKKK